MPARSALTAKRFIEWDKKISEQGQKNLLVRANKLKIKNFTIKYFFYLVTFFFFQGIDAAWAYTAPLFFCQ